MGAPVVMKTASNAINAEMLKSYPRYDEAQVREHFAVLAAL